jgi:hypothetical protein
MSFFKFIGEQLEIVTPTKTKKETNHQSHTAHISISQNLPCELRTRSITKTTKSISKEARKQTNKQTTNRQTAGKTKTKTNKHHIE